MAAACKFSMKDARPPCDPRRPSSGRRATPKRAVRRQPSPPDERTASESSGCLHACNGYMNGYMNGRCTADHTLTPPCEEARLSLYGLPPTAATAACPRRNPAALRFIYFSVSPSHVCFQSRYAKSLETREISQAPGPLNRGLDTHSYSSPSV